MFFRSNNWSLALRKILLHAKQSLKDLTVFHRHVGFLIYIYLKAFFKLLICFLVIVHLGKL